MLPGLLGIALTIVALNSRFYRALNARYDESHQSVDAPEADLTPDPAEDPRL